ncbi:MAG: hypothetical protein ACTSR8_08700 [Promethearchaeota archaeon]
MPLIDELWILSIDGRPLVNFCKEGIMDESLICCFFSAITAFSYELAGKEGLKSITLQEYKFTYSPCCDGKALLVCKSNADVKDKKIYKICKIIKNILEDLHSGESINNWDGDLSYFEEFKNRLNLYFKMSNL